MFDNGAQCSKHNRISLWQWISLQLWSLKQRLYGYSVGQVHDNEMYYGCGCKR